LKCEKHGLQSGAISDATGLSDQCLETGSNPQPDPSGRIALTCATKLIDVINQHCSSTDLTQAFAPCNTNDPSTLAPCLRGESACQMCRLLNDVDLLARDCDLFDDGDTNNGSCQAECGDSVLQLGENCDDGNTNANDGCSATCAVESGWGCTGQPSVC